MRYMDIMKPKIQTGVDSGKPYEFTPGTGKDSGLVVKNKQQPKEPFFVPVKKTSKVISVASPRG